MTLIIAEKKELAEAIADAIAGRSSRDGASIKKGDYTIVWCSGHLLALKEPEDYDEKYSEWSMSQLPIYFPDWEMKIGKSRPKQTNKSERMDEIGKLLQQADLVIHAGDCDDEGQLIVDEVLRWHHYNGPVKRLNTSDTTAPALHRALSNMQDNTEVLQREGWAAYARSVSDALVGFNLTRAMSVANQVFLTVGRVQTPTLGLVVNRDRLIEGHKKTIYYGINVMVDVDGKDVPAEYVPAEDNPNLTEGKILDKTYAEKIANALQNYAFNDIKVEKKTVTESPPLPFNLTKLTTYCSSHFGIDNVMEITQSLRDKYKAITYNRTDSQYLGDEHFKQAPNTLKFVMANTGIHPAEIDPKIKSKCFDQSKISVHFAIIPTAQSVDISKMTEQERKVYLAIAKRYMLQFLPPAKKMRTTLTAPLPNGASVRSTSTVVTSPGFLALESPDKKDSSSPLSGIDVGTYDGVGHDAKVNEKETKPPARYTPASLEEDMSRIAKYVTDPEAKKMLLAKDKERTGENGSIGTTATREHIIQSLIKRDFLRLEKKSVVSTDKGRKLYDAMPDQFRLADTTAKWWAVQEDIKEGRATPDTLIQSVLSSVQDFLNHDIPRIGGVARPGSNPVGPCPICGKSINETTKGFICEGFDKEDPNSCKFYVAKKTSTFTPLIGKTVTASMMKKMLNGEAVLVKGLTKKDHSGKYDALLSLVKGDGNDKRIHWKIAFPEREPLGTCPACKKGDIIKGKYGFGCTGWKNDPPCHFVIPYVNTKFPPLANHKVTETEMKKLLDGKEILVKKIPKKGGNGTYDAYFKIKKNDKGFWGLQLERFAASPEFREKKD